MGEVVGLGGYEVISMRGLGMAVGVTYGDDTG